MKLNDFATIKISIYNDLKKYTLPALFALLGLTILQIVFKRICPISIITGYPCPGCGITRACFFFLTFQWNLAFSYNPTIFLWLFVIAWGIFLRYFIKDNAFKNNHKKIFIRTVTIVGIISITVYIVRMNILYPNVPPMTYNTFNVLHLLHKFLVTYITP